MSLSGIFMRVLFKSGLHNTELNSCFRPWLGAVPNDPSDDSFLNSVVQSNSRSVAMSCKAAAAICWANEGVSEWCIICFTSNPASKLGRWSRLAAAAFALAAIWRTPGIVKDKKQDHGTTLLIKTALARLSNYMATEIYEPWWLPLKDIWCVIVCIRVHVNGCTRVHT